MGAKAPFAVLRAGPLAQAFEVPRSVSSTNVARFFSIIIGKANRRGSFTSV
jgi:hypothetical protein